MTFLGFPSCSPHATALRRYPSPVNPEPSAGASVPAVVQADRNHVGPGVDVADVRVRVFGTPRRIVGAGDLDARRPPGTRGHRRSRSTAPLRPPCLRVDRPGRARTGCCPGAGHPDLVADRRYLVPYATNEVQLVIDRVLAADREVVTVRRTSRRGAAGRAESPSIPETSRTCPTHELVGGEYLGALAHHLLEADRQRLRKRERRLDVVAVAGEVGRRGRSRPPGRSRPATDTLCRSWCPWLA